MKIHWKISLCGVTYTSGNASHVRKKKPNPWKHLYVTVITKTLETNFMVVMVHQSSNHISFGLVKLLEYVGRIRGEIHQILFA